MVHPCLISHGVSFAYKMSPSGDHVLVVGKGKITTDECISLVRRILSDPRHQPDATGLIDLRKATYELKHPAEIIRIAKALESFHSVLKNNIAIVAKRAMLFPAEILSLHVRATKHIGIRVFLNLTAAKNFCMWPGLPTAEWCGLPKQEMAWKSGRQRQQSQYAPENKAHPPG